MLSSGRSVLFAICVYLTLKINVSLVASKEVSETARIENQYTLMDIFLDQLTKLQTEAKATDQLKEQVHSLDAANEKLQSEFNISKTNLLNKDMRIGVFEENEKAKNKHIDDLRENLRVIAGLHKEKSDQCDIIISKLNEKEKQIDDITKEKDQQVFDLREHMKLISNTQTEKNKQNEEEIVHLNEKLNENQKTVQEKESQIENLKSEVAQQKQKIEATSCLPFANSTDIHVIKLPEIDPFLAPCNSSVSGSGWTVIQRRVDGSVNFNRSWEEYKHGFGDLRGNLFLGLEKIHLMTKNQQHELYIEMRDVNGTSKYALYDTFLLGSEEEDYELKSIGRHSGSTGDAMMTHVKKKFSTFDRDNDEDENSCARVFGGGWWFYHCHTSMLNGKYVESGVINKTAPGIQWGFWKEGEDSDYTISLIYTQMLIRPISV